jgi:hypothetical protein
MMETEFREESLAIAQKLKAHAEKKGLTAGDFAVGWVLAHPAVTSVIAGPRTLAQWNAYIGLARQALRRRGRGAGRFARCGPGHPSTPGYNDPNYPLTGRVRRA